VKPCSTPHLTESRSRLTVRSWLGGITTTEVQQKPLIPPIPSSLTHGLPMPQDTALPPQSSSQTSNWSPYRAGLWQRASSICLPSLFNTEYCSRIGGEDTEVALVQKSTCFPKTPIRNFRQLNRFLSLAGQMLGLMNDKYSMAVGPNFSLLTSM